MRVTINRISQIVGLGALVTATFVPAFAQGDPDAARRRSDQDLEQRVFNLGVLRKGPSEKGGSKEAKNSDSQVVLSQVQDDFTMLQLVDNDLAETVAHSGALDLAFVAKSLVEISKRAERLMNNLTQAKSSKSSKLPNPDTLADREQLKQSLLAMDKVVGDFAHNPVFKEASHDDAKLGAQALRDLEQIIVLCDQARKNTEKFLEEVQRSP